MPTPVVAPVRNAMSEEKPTCFSVISPTMMALRWLVSESHSK